MLKESFGKRKKKIHLISVLWRKVSRSLAKIAIDTRSSRGNWLYVQYLHCLFNSGVFLLTLKTLLLLWLLCHVQWTLIKYVFDFNPVMMTRISWILLLGSGLGCSCLLKSHLRIFIYYLFSEHCNLHFLHQDLAQECPV